MSGLRFDEPVFSPKPLARPRKPPDPGAAAASRRAIRGVLAIALIPNAVGLLVAWVPEVAGWRFLRPAVSQLAPLIAAGLVADGETLAVGQTAVMALGAEVLLVAAVALAVAALRSGPWRFLLLPAGVGVAVGAAVSVLGALWSDRLAEFAVGAALAVLAGVLALRGAVQLFRARVGTDQTARPGRLLTLYLVLVPLPLAVGRAVFAPALGRAVRGTIGGPGGVALTALEPQVTVMLIGAGAAVGVVVWGSLRLLPPWRGRALTKPIAWTVVAAIVGVGIVGAQVRAAAAPVTTALRTTTVLPPAGYCDFDIASGSQSWSALLWDDGCRTITLYRGQEVVGQHVVPAVMLLDKGVRVAGDRQATEGPLLVTYWGASVVVGSVDGDTADVAVAWSNDTGRELWRFSCPSGPIRALRFAGKGDAPADGFLSRKGDGERVVLVCGKGTYRIDPLTGDGLPT